MLRCCVFHLSKWYLDCVGEDGSVFLAYRAELCWRDLRLHFASVLDHDTLLQETPPPRQTSGVWQWESPCLGVSAHWDPLDQPVHRTLIEGVDWSCHVPRGRAQAVVRGKHIRGLGYVEHLTLTVPPWRLPIRELRWGRFLGEQTGLVWIECSGPHPLSEVFLNGSPADAAVLEALVLDAGRTLRDGPISTILSGIGKLFPARILQLRETKKCSRGLLRDDAGWAIHEEVRWP